MADYEEFADPRDKYSLGILGEQDDEYNESLARDAEKDLLKKRKLLEERALGERKLLEEQALGERKLIEERALENAQRELDELKMKFDSIPEHHDGVLVRVRTPCGMSRRRFDGSTMMTTIRDWILSTQDIDLYVQKKDAWRISQTFPKIDIDDLNVQLSSLVNQGDRDILLVLV